jgi:hypothetical protein
MQVRLDLSSSRAKIARANVHLQSLIVEAESVVHQRHPFSGRFVRAPQDGCWTLMMRSGDFNEPQLGVIFGDFIHNLRSALDYIITALVDASPGAVLNTGHQFPIFDTAAAYDARVHRYLQGITVGRDEVRRVQPFNAVEPHHDMLFAIQFFSNSDKHRVISQYYPTLHLVDEARVSPDAGIVHREVFNPPNQWRPGEEFPLIRVCYDPPRATSPAFTGNVTVIVYFGAPALAQDDPARAIPIGGLQDVSNHVAAIVDSFENL